MAFVQVAGGEGPSPALLSRLKFLGNLVPSSGSPHTELASNQLKCIKSSLLFQHSASELWAKGGDAPERLKKDQKFKLLFAACAHQKAVTQAVEAIEKWQTANSEMYNKALTAAQTGEQETEETGIKKVVKNLDASHHLMILDIVTKLTQRALSEKDQCVEDCVDVQSVAFKRNMDSITTSLRKVCQGLYSGGPSDWKGSLKDDCKLEDLLTKATATILKIKGSSIKESVDVAVKDLFSLCAGAG